MVFQVGPNRKIKEFIVLWEVLIFEGDNIKITGQSVGRLTLGAVKPAAKRIQIFQGKLLKKLKACFNSNDACLRI